MSTCFPYLVELSFLRLVLRWKLFCSLRLRGIIREHCLDCSVLARPLRVRNWRSGDRFWPAHTKGPKKIKELLQDRRVLGREKRLWPVVAER